MCAVCISAHCSHLTQLTRDYMQIFSDRCFCFSQGPDCVQVRHETSSEYVPYTKKRRVLACSCFLSTSLTPAISFPQLKMLIYTDFTSRTNVSWAQMSTSASICSKSSFVQFWNITVYSRYPLLPPTVSSHHQRQRSVNVLTLAQRDN